MPLASDTKSGVTNVPRAQTTRVIPANNLVGSLPTGLPAKLSNLEEFRISDNKQLKGGFPADFGDFPLLSVLMIYRTGLTGTIPSSLAKLSGSLTKLALFRNQLSGPIPTEVGDLIHVSYLDLDRNDFSGALPTQLGLMTNMSRMFTSVNPKISGTLPTQLGKMSKLTNIGISGTSISGTIPTQLGLLSKILYLNLNDNRLSGTIPEKLWTVGNKGYISRFWASNNYLTGTISSRIPASIDSFHIDGNLMSGSIPSTLFTGIMKDISLQDNQLTGTLPTEIARAVLLEDFDVYSNQISGSIPSQFGQLTKLGGIHVYNNRLTGTLPDTLLGPSSGVQHLQVANNNLTGTLPLGCHSAPRLSTVDVSGNPWSESLEDFLEPLLERVKVGTTSFASAGCVGPSKTLCNDIEALTIDSTGLTGTIPQGIIGLAAMRTFILRGNHLLTGTLPEANADVLGGLVVSVNLVQIRALGAPQWVSVDISANPGLTGVVPESWGDMLSLDELNISDTGLSSGDSSVMSWVSTVPGDFDTFPPRDDGVSTLSILCPHFVAPSVQATIIMDPSYYNWSLCGCRDGHMGGRGNCFECPYGGNCEDGFVFKSTLDFWCETPPDGDATVLTHSPTCKLCTANTCCPNPDGCLLSSQCVQNRIGITCGLCEPGHGVNFGSESCAPNKDCTGASWVVPLLLIGCVGGSLYLVLQNPLQPKDVVVAPPWDFIGVCAFNVIFNFYQLASLVLGRLASGSAATFMSVVMSVFTLQVSGSGNSNAVCLFPDLSPLNKVALGYVPPFILFAITLAVSLSVEVIADRVSVPVERIKNRFTIVKDYRGAAYAMISLGDFTYSALLQTTFALVNCFNLNGSKLLTVSAATKCYTGWQISMLVLLIPVLSLYPLFLWWISRQALTRHTPRWQAVQIAVNLVYRDCRWWWGPIVLYRRFVMIIGFTFIENVVWRALFLTFGMALSAMLNTALKPHRITLIQWLDNVFFVALTGLGACSVALSVYEERGLPVHTSHSELRASFAENSQVMVGILVVIPVIAMFIAGLLIAVQAYRSVLRTGTFAKSSLYVRGAAPHSGPGGDRPLSLELSDDGGGGRDNGSGVSGFATRLGAGLRNAASGPLEDLMIAHRQHLSNARSVPRTGSVSSGRVSRAMSVAENLMDRVFRPQPRQDGEWSDTDAIMMASDYDNELANRQRLDTVHTEGKSQTSDERPHSMMSLDSNMGGDGLEMISLRPASLGHLANASSKASEGGDETDTGSDGAAAGDRNGTSPQVTRSAVEQSVGDEKNDDSPVLTTSTPADAFGNDRNDEGVAAGDTDGVDSHGDNAASATP